MLKNRIFKNINNFTIILIAVCIILIQISGLGPLGNFYNSLYLLGMVLIFINVYEIRKNMYSIYFFIILFLLILPLFYIDFFYISFSSIKDYVIFSLSLLVPFLLYKRITKYNYNIIHISIVIMFVLITIVGILDLIYNINFLYPSSELMGNRVSAGNSSSSPWGGYLSVFAMGSLYYMFRQKIMYLVFCYSIVLLNIYMSGQRMAIILFFTSLIILIIFDKNKRLIKILFIIVSILFFYFNGFTMRNDNSLSSLNLNNDSTIINTIIKEQQNKRLALYRDSLEILYKNYFLGIGPGELNKYYQEYKSNTSETSSLLQPHSLYLDILLRLGIIGLMIYVFFIFNLSKRIFNSGSEKTVSLLFLNVAFNPLQLSHSFNEVWFSLIFITSVSLILNYKEISGVIK